MKFLKITAVSLMFALILCLFSCEKSEQSTKSVSFDYCEAQVFELFEEMVKSDEFAKLFNIDVSNPYYEKLRGVDTSSCKAVYFLQMTDEFYSVAGIDLTKHEGALKERLEYSIASTIGTFANRSLGTNAMVVSSAYSAGYTDVCTEVTKQIRNLYVYENNVALMLVATPHHNGAATLSLSVVFCDLLDTSSAAALASSFKQLGAPIAVGKV